MEESSELEKRASATSSSSRNTGSIFGSSPSTKSTKSTASTNKALLDLSTIDCSVMLKDGTLEKKSPSLFAGWQTREFRLYPSALLYSVPTKWQPTTQQCIRLVEIKKVNHDPGQTIFNLVSDRKAYTIKAASGKVAADWCAAILIAKDKLQDNGGSSENGVQKAQATINKVMPSSSPTASNGTNGVSKWKKAAKQIGAMNQIGGAASRVEKNGMILKNMNNQNDEKDGRRLDGRHVEVMEIKADEDVVVVRLHPRDEQIDVRTDQVGLEMRFFRKFSEILGSGPGGMAGKNLEESSNSSSCPSGKPEQKVASQEGRESEDEDEEHPPLCNGPNLSRWDNRTMADGQSTSYYIKKILKEQNLEGLTDLLFTVNDKNKVSDVFVDSLAEAFKSNLAIIKLDLANQGITRPGGIALGKGLQGNTVLSILSLRQNHLGDNGVAGLAFGLKKNQGLRSLDLADTLISDQGSFAIAQCLHENRSLTKVGLDKNKITGPGAIALGKALSTNTTLTTLDLSDNAISDTGAAGLSECLKTNKSLRELTLANVDIGDKGAEYFCEGLKRNVALDTLDLQSNHIGDAGAQSLGEGLHHNSTLTEINLSTNRISGAGATAFFREVVENTKLHDVYLAGNEIDNCGCGGLSEALRHNKALKTLILMSNRISDAGIQDFIKPLKDNNVLHSVDLDMNPITNMGAKAVKKAFTKSDFNGWEVDWVLETRKEHAEKYMFSSFVLSREVPDSDSDSG